MTPQRLPHVLKAYRIGDPGGEFPIYSGAGAKIAPGRWNLPTSPMIYAGLDYATAMLEKLAHGSGVMPPNQHYIELVLSALLSYEQVDVSTIPGWDAKDGAPTKAFGDTWYQEKRSLLLMVPSVVTRLTENVLINPTHPEFPLISDGRPYPVRWDTRLFSVPTPTLASVEEDSLLPVDTTEAMTPPPKIPARASAQITLGKKRLL